MPTQKKIEAVKDLADILAKTTVAIATDYRGLTNAELSQLRRKLRERGIAYHVVKNTLARLAGEQSGRAGLASLTVGPTALAFGYGDVVEPARILVDYVRGTKTVLTIKGGLLSNRMLSADEVTALAYLPPREIILAQLLGQLQAPMASLLGVLSGNARSLLGVLQARIQQLEGEAA